LIGLQCMTSQSGRPTKFSVLRLASLVSTIYAIGVIVITTILVTLATNAEKLIPFAFPFAFVVIGLAQLRGARVELIVWGLLTIWLGSTYLQTGEAFEWFAFAAFVALAVLGAWKSPYLLALAWLLHPLWDFVPRELPDNLQDLPVACILFDIPIGIYLFVSTRRARLGRISRAA
jgi:hypothetical protein